MAAPPTPTATSTTSDGPVLNLINRRLRALRKKHNRIIQMEESLSQGKTLNNEQLDVLRSKSAVVTLIDEFEKLRAPISVAVDEELSLALAKTSEGDPVKERVQEDYRSDDIVDDAVDGNNDNASAEVVNGGDDSESKSNAVRDLVNLMYFGSLFDVKQQSEFTSLMLTRTHERGCCLTYDYVTDDATDLLGERDLDLISALQGLMIARPVHSTLSHQNALEQCFEHAKKWLENSDQPIDSQSSVTYAALREKLSKIMSSDYLTATPQMKGPGEVAAAAAVANFGSFQVPLHESMANVDVPVQVEGSPEQYQESQENAAAGYEEYETTEPQSGKAEEFQKDELEHENSSEVISGQVDQEQYQNSEGEQGYRNVDFKDQQYVHRRGQRGGRGGGGGRRGFSNGRGGRGNGRGNGPYQNGRNQYYDNYYPSNRTYYNRRGRGGPAGGANGGGGGYYNNSSGAQGNYPQENVGVAS